MSAINTAHARAFNHSRQTNGEQNGAVRRIKHMNNRDSRRPSIRRCTWRIALLCMALLSASGAQAQLSLPQLPLPRTSGTPLPQPAETQINALTHQLDTVVVDATAELD